MLQYFKNKKRLLAFFVVSIAIFWAFLWIRAGAPQILVENNSGQAMTEVSVKFDGKNHNIGELAAGKSYAIDVEGHREGILELHAVLTSGTRLHISGRYSVAMRWTNSGLDAKLRINIGTNGLVTIK
jgi:hypothetical protein